MFQQKCFSRLHDFQQAGKTIVLVTRDPQVVTRHCSRAIVIEYGAVLCDTTPMEAVSRYYEVLYGEGPTPLVLPEPEIGLAQSSHAGARLVAELFALGDPADGLAARPNYSLQARENGQPHEPRVEVAGPLANLEKLAPPPYATRDVREQEAAGRPASLGFILLPAPAAGSALDLRSSADGRRSR